MKALLLLLTLILIEDCIGAECDTADTWTKTNWNPAYRYCCTPRGNALTVGEPGCIKKKYCWSHGEKRWGFNPLWRHDIADHGQWKVMTHPTESFVSTVLQREAGNTISVALPWDTKTGEPNNVASKSLCQENDFPPKPPQVSISCCQWLWHSSALSTMICQPMFQKVNGRTMSTVSRSEIKHIPQLCSSPN